jgi:hypothetical protein
MAVRNRLARDGRLYILTTGTLTITDGDTASLDATAEWTAIEHVKNITPGRGRTTAPTTSYDDAGNASHVVTERAFTFTGNYNLRGDTTDGTRPAGQEALELLGESIGDEAIGSFYYQPFAEADVWAFEGSVELGSFGGGDVNALAEVSFTIEATGVVYKGVELVIPAP